MDRRKVRLRLRVAAVLATFALVLVACSDDGGGGTTGGSGAATGGGENYKVTLITGDNHDPFMVTMVDGCKAAAEKLGVEFDWQAPAEWDVQQQIPVMDAVLASSPDAVLVQPTDVTALIEPIRQFDEAGIKVITVDTDVEDTSVRLANITSDNKLGGQLAAEFLDKQLPAGAKVLLMGPVPGIYTTDLRKEGFEEAIAKTDLDYVDYQSNNDDPVQVAQQVAAVLQKHPDLAGIFAMDTFNGEGSGTAVQEAGLGDQVTIISFDAGPAEVEKLKAGVMDALIVQKAYDMGSMGIEFAVDALNGESLEPQTYTDYVIATQENIDTPEVQQYIYKEL
jgi:ribose transport system substrate-binding protein